MKREEAIAEIDRLLSKAKQDLVEVGEILDDIELGHLILDHPQSSNISTNAQLSLLH